MCSGVCYVDGASITPYDNMVSVMHSDRSFAKRQTLRVRPDAGSLDGGTSRSVSDGLRGPLEHLIVTYPP